MTSMWYEKYKPKCVNDMILDDTIKNKMKKYVNSKIVPNILITGTHGTGKTVLLDCLMREIYGNYKYELTYTINSSIDNNVRSFQDSLELFCKKKILAGIGNKLIVVDDIDNINEKLQNVIASTMENYPTVSFAFSCSSISNVIESIQSRVVILKLYRQSDKTIIPYLKKICSLEKCHYDDDAIIMINFNAQCDIRAALNILQIICNGYGNVTIENINKLCDTPNPIILKNIIKLCINNEKNKLVKNINSLFQDGYNGSDILSGLFDVVKDPNYTDINDEHKMILLELIGKQRYKISKKIDTLLQLESCVLDICKKFNNIS